MVSTIHNIHSLYCISYLKCYLFILYIFPKQSFTNFLENKPVNDGAIDSINQVVGGDDCIRQCFDPNDTGLNFDVIFDMIKCGYICFALFGYVGYVHFTDVDDNTSNPSFLYITISTLMIIGFSYIFSIKDNIIDKITTILNKLKSGLFNEERINLVIIGAFVLFICINPQKKISLKKWKKIKKCFKNIFIYIYLFSYMFRKYLSNVLWDHSRIITDNYVDTTLIGTSTTNFINYAIFIVTIGLLIGLSYLLRSYIMNIVSLSVDSITLIPFLGSYLLYINYLLHCIPHICGYGYGIWI